MSRPWHDISREATHNPVGLSERQTIGCIPAGHTGVEFRQTSMHRMGFPPQITIFKRHLCGHATLLNIQKWGISKHTTQLNTSRITEVHLSFTTVFSCSTFDRQCPSTASQTALFQYSLHIAANLVAIWLEISLLKLDFRQQCNYAVARRLSAELPISNIF